MTHPPRLILAVAVVLAFACAPGETGPPDAQAKPRDSGSEADAEILADAPATHDRPAPDAAPFDAAPADAGPPPDSDLDGIPDARDPEPHRPNTLLFADDFARVDSSWIFSSVSMRIDPDRGVLAVDVLEPFEREGWIGPRPSWGDMLVLTTLRIGRRGGTKAEAGVIARVSQVTPSRYVSCGVDLEEDLALLVEHEGVEARVLASAPFSAALDQSFDVSLFARAAFYRCQVGEVVLEASSSVFFSGSIGFRSFDATFEADWVEVYAD